MPSCQTFSPSGRAKWRSKEYPNVSARYSKSEIVKLSRFIFELKFCGIVPIRLASSATLMLQRTHSTLICSDMVIRVLLAIINLLIEDISILFYIFNAVPHILFPTIKLHHLQLKNQIFDSFHTLFRPLLYLLPPKVHGYPIYRN